MEHPYWAILVLRDFNEPIPVSDVEHDLRQRWDKVVCRFPAVKQGLLDRSNPLSSYVFVQTPVSSKIERSVYATRFLRDPGTRKLQKVTDAELLAMAPTILLPSPGETVIVTVGDWAGLEATVVEAAGEQVQVLVELWSKRAVLKLLPNEYLHHA